MRLSLWRSPLDLPNVKEVGWTNGFSLLQAMWGNGCLLVLSRLSTGRNQYSRRVGGAATIMVYGFSSDSCTHTAPFSCLATTRPGFLSRLLVILPIFPSRFRVTRYCSSCTGLLPNYIPQVLFGLLATLSGFLWHTLRPQGLSRSLLRNLRVCVVVHFRVCTVYISKDFVP